MRTSSLTLNPFSLMMEPETVLQAMERSPSLRRLKRHQLSPLDRPLIPKIARAAMDELDDGCDEAAAQPPH